MATAKKLEFQAERKAAAWQGGKPQPAPLPADVHAATCLVDSDGEAARTAYPVFPGIEIAYHDVHAASAATQRACAAGCLEIHHCREGRIAYPYGDACFFLAPGDLAIVQRAAEAVPVRFPTGHYHGITVTIDPARAPDCLSCFLEDVEVRPSALIEKFCADGACFVTRSSPGVAHIFSELYSVPEGIRKGYFKVKILELLLFLCVSHSGGAAAARLFSVAGAARRADRRVPASKHGAAADGCGALAVLRRFGHTDQQQLSRRVRHVAGGVFACAENAWRCQTFAPDRPHSAGYCRAIRV